MRDIIKVCKKHGELSVSQTYIMLTKNKNKCVMCLICKKGYRRDWAKLNPEKVKLRQDRIREQRLGELKDGTLKKKCPKCGDLPIEKIRVDARGTLVCRPCSNLIKRKSIAKVDPNLERYRLWLYSDRERVKRYRQNDKPKRRIRQIKAYHRMKIEDPVNHRRKEAIKLKSAIKYRKELRDNYVKTILMDIRTGSRENLTRFRLDRKMISQELIELKKIQLLLKRKIKDVNKNNEGTSAKNVESV